MRKVFIVVMLLFLTSCTPPDYPRKQDDNLDYYVKYMEHNGITKYKEIDCRVNVESINIAYQIVGINQTTDSFFIYYYEGINQNGDIVHVLMPDKKGEDNLIFTDHLPSFEELKVIVQGYNDSSVSIETDLGGNLVNTNDIEIDEAELRRDFVNYLYLSRKVNDKIIDVDKEGIKELILNNLSSPIIYRVARYYESDYYTRIKYVYVGKGIEHDLVFILEDFSTAEVEIIFYYDYE